MSNYYRKTKHPRTGEWEIAKWYDNMFGPNHNGVVFPSDVIKNPDVPFWMLAFDSEKTKLEVANG